MSDIISLADFQDGAYTIPQDSYIQAAQQSYLDKYEKKYLIELLGVALYDLVIADLVAGVPATPIYLALYDPFYIDSNSSIKYSEGMKAMLIQLVYFYLVRDLPVKKSSSGVGFNVNEVTNGPSYSGFNIVESFNEGVDNYAAIQWYIRDNATDYPSEPRQHLNYISGI